VSELPISIYKAAARYKKIETDGLTLYPVLVREYELHLLTRPALEVMHQSLPVALMRVPLLSALYQIDYETVLKGEPSSGLFSRSLLALSLSLRLGEGEEMEERLKRFKIMVDPKNPAQLQRIRFSDADGEEKEISPTQYSKLRQIIAAQNGVRLESDMANPDLVKAEKDIASASDLNLDANIEDWISAVSALTGASEEEIDEWPILKFQRRSDSLQRILSYIVCGVGECSGASWKGGNPVPHPFFARLKDGRGVLSALGATSDGKTKEPPKAGLAIQEITKNLSP
jgi:hypothetical protein